MFSSSRKNKVYVPDRMGRLGQGHWVEQRDPFGRLSEPGNDAEFDLSNPFNLGKPVGRSGRNERPDVAKVENLLGKSGHLDLDKTDGPTGYFGTRLEEAVKRFQKDHGLKPDAFINPGGETISAMANIPEVAESLGGQGAKGHVAPTKPTVEKPKPPVPPEVPGAKRKVDGNNKPKPSRRLSKKEKQQLELKLRWLKMRRDALGE